jgi:coenzyme F420-0:L-glutamate ligase/coenzyme F420-1:gamma-L-glutamate ligase
MHVIPIHMDRPLVAGDVIATLLTQQKALHSGDIVVVSSKAIATAEGASVDLSTKTITAEARAWSEKTGQNPAFVQAILDELVTWNGRIVHHCPGALLTELSPTGMHGAILIANAGLDQSNAGEGHAIGWPRNPQLSADLLQRSLSQILMQRVMENSHSNAQYVATPRLTIEKTPDIAVIVSDSCCSPRRRGVTAMALAVAGLEPIMDRSGEEDLFGRALRLTSEAVADQLATAANTVMGNGAECTPAAVIRDHGITLHDWHGWVPGMRREEDLFGPL